MYLTRDRVRINVNEISLVVHHLSSPHQGLTLLS